MSGTPAAMSQSALNLQTTETPMRLVTAFLALALAAPSLALAAGQNKSIMAPTVNTWKAVVTSSMATMKSVPKRTLESAKFAKFRSDPKNYLLIKMSPKVPKGAVIEGGMSALVGKKIYPNKMFVGSSFMGRTMWKWGEQPKF